MKGDTLAIRGLSSEVHLWFRAGVLHTIRHLLLMDVVHNSAETSPTFGSVKVFDAGGRYG